MKYFFFIFRILRSLIYDIFYFFSYENLRQRAATKNYYQYRNQKRYPNYLKVGSAVNGIQYLAQKHCVGRGYDIGCSKWPISGAVPIEDNIDENAYKLLSEDGEMDFVFCSHLLEHLESPKLALAEWGRVLKRDGILLLYLPHPACSMWSPEALAEHIWMPDPLSVSSLLKTAGFVVDELSYTPDGMMSYFVLARKL